MDLQETKDRMVDFWTGYGFTLDVANSLEKAFSGKSVSQLLHMHEAVREYLIREAKLSEKICWDACIAVEKAIAKSHQRTSRDNQIGRIRSAVLNPYFIES